MLFQVAVAAFVKWVYEDEVDVRVDAQGTVALLRVANFFGAPHLVTPPPLCPVADRAGQALLLCASTDWRSLARVQACCGAWGHCSSVQG